MISNVYRMISGRWCKWGTACLLLACWGCGKIGESAVPAVKPMVAVEVMEVRGSEWIEGIPVTGTLEPKFRADIKAEVAGVVRQVFVSEWVRVRKGDKLARIDVRESEAIVKRCKAAVEAALAAHAD